jgi:pimeloyl-ACP methyl ester carboxylesterase
LSSLPLSYHRAGTGPPLVLIHGIGSHWQVWKPVLDWLTPVRDVIALDLPGFGASPAPPPGTPPGIESLIRLTAQFLDEMHLERPHVAGNSLGGWLALELAKRNRVASATALSPGGFATGLDARFLGLSLRMTLSMTRRLAPRARGITRYRLLRRLVMGQMVANPLRVPAEDAAAAVRAAAAAPWFETTLSAIVAETFRPAGTVPVPVTVAWGGKDFLLPRWQARRAARALPGARMLTLPGCGHLCTYDDPALVARVLIEGSSVT